MSLSIVPAEDHRIVREGLRAILEREPDIGVVAEADDGASAVHLAQEHHPDIVVMDVSMPGTNGIEATRRIVECGSSRVLALSMHMDRRIVMDMMAAGACGYVLKDCASEELVTAIRAVAAEEIYLSRKVAALIVEECIRRPPSRPTGGTLTNREREILREMSDGRNTKEIAFLLDVSVKTVESYRQQIMRKLNLYTVAELVKYAIREGITRVE